ncbi:TRAPP trafficking subunit Trs65-domain-containing protein [Microdochium trichocladiopsis]|uniref:TRAPP trafficking subunit Trs65-domain-containing protein n=1 Tax=Microdochium trichocladiopsis TaxID=1682393 RepID=A0A9P9BN38_9PEZI|nr:TRAPP trafficking subunit Trs65-domain-containing protein [Microdochium trichocladiopsis]KAH7026561.1 TRAPP trafficking subunit Trs65-domain-containing protein [Microdochium trichocladiopsis]
MAVPMLDDGTDMPLDFVECSSLTYFVPLDSALDLETAFDPSDAEPFAGVDCRESLFFDENVQLYLVLKTTHGDNESLQAILRGLSIAVEAQVVNNSGLDKDSAASSEVIFSGTLNGSESPQIVSSVGRNEAAGCTCVVWKLPVFLARPRMRLQKPAVIITANASLMSTTSSVVDASSDGYLTSGVPSSLNLLGAIGTDPSLNGVKPRLSALRVSRVAPVTQHAQDHLRPIKSLSKLTTKIFPVCHSRVRFSRPNAKPTTTTVIAILEVDFTPFFDCEVILNSITLELADGTVENLTDHADLRLPLSCVAHDHVVFLYRVAPADDLTVAKNPTRDMDITITATALVEPGQCEPELKMAWRAAVDFTLPLNPGYGATMQPMQRSHRPGQLSIGGDSMTSLIAPSVARPDALPSLEASTTRVEKSVPELGITMTFTAPPTDLKISIGSEFAWNIFIVNRSSSATSMRKLALVVIPRRRRNEARVTRPPSMSRPFGSFSSIGQPHGKAAAQRDRSVADAVMDDNIVHAMQRSSIVDSADVACLSGDVRVGPLAAGACHSVELKFLALRSGIVSVEAVRVVDLATNEHVDVRDLPTTIVEALD